jgi:hypothetical protein
MGHARGKQGCRDNQRTHQPHARTSAPLTFNAIVTVQPPAISPHLTQGFRRERDGQQPKQPRGIVPPVALDVLSMSDAKQLMRPIPSGGYEADFYAWTVEQAARLRSERPNHLDWENLAEEIEGLGRSDRREISSRLLVILVHLLKWQAQPGKRKSGWRSTVIEQRHKIVGLIAESPSLAKYPQRALADEYPAARSLAAAETDLDPGSFPKACPFTIDQILDENFWPEGA